MTLKGDWGSSTQYAVNDVVRFTDGVVYVAQKVPPVGATPHDTLYWGRYHSQEVISMMIDAINALTEMIEEIAPEADEEITPEADDGGET